MATRSNKIHNVFSLTIITLFCFAIVLLAGVLILGCDDDDDDDDDGPSPQDGWSGGCTWEYDGSEESELTTTAVDDEDCLPPDPGNNENYEMLAEMLAVFGGTYIDQNDRTIEITCRPEGRWVIPEPKENTLCIYSWIISVWITLADTGEKYETTIEQGYPNFDTHTQLSFLYDEEAGWDGIVWGSVEGDIYGEWHWKLTNGDRWTKVE